MARLTKWAWKNLLKTKRITGINVKVGDEVQAGDTVVVLEAMKMANNIETEKSGKVTAVCVKVGQSVMEDDALVVVE